MFRNFPDIVNIQQITEMLNIGKSSAYNLLKTQQIRHVRIGTKYIIPRQSVIDFTNGICYNDNRITGGTLPKGASL